MSTRGVMSNRLYVNVDIPFEDAWNDLTNEDRKQIISENISLLNTDDLISELEHRGFSIINGN
jgi:hypothetical protein